MLGRLFLLFTLVPIAELYLLVTLGGLMGVWPTLALVAGTGFAGAWLARREGRRALASYQESLSKGQLPEDGIVSGLLLLAGAVMLITPGVLTDVFGLAMMVPPLRRGVASLVQKRLQKRIESGDVQVLSSGGVSFSAGFGGAGPGPFGAGQGGFGPGAGPSAGGIVDAEIVDAEVVEPSEAGSALRRRGE